MKYVKKAGYIVATIFFLVFTLGPFVWTFVMAITPKAEMFSNVVIDYRVDEDQVPDRVHIYKVESPVKP